MKVFRGKRHSKDIALISVTVALIIVLQALAEVLQVIGLQISLALGLIPVLVAAQLRGWKVGAVCGLAFGLVSMSIALIRYLGVPVWNTAINPLVSVVPRVIVGIFAALVYTAIGKARAKRPGEKGKLKGVTDYFQSAAATLAGVLTNTVLFLGMFFAFAHGKADGVYTVNMEFIVGTIIAFNTVIEAVAYTALVPAIVIALAKSEKYGLFLPDGEKEK